MSRSDTDYGARAQAGGIAAVRSAGAFLNAFADHAGWRGVGATALVGAGAVLEGVGVLLLIPILGVVVPGGAPSAWRSWLNSMLSAVGATTPTVQLGVLLTAFLIVAVVRGGTLYARDIALARLQGGFVEALRNRTLATLAAAPWSRIVSLRHARITNLIGIEMQRIAASAQFVIQGGVALVLLIVQAALAFSLAPKFAAVAIVVLTIGAVALLGTFGRTRDLGGDVVRQSQAMMGSAATFLGGLKAAAAQNGQGRFVAEFAAIQSALKQRQIAYARRTARSRTVFGLGSALAGAAVVFGGVVSGVPPPVLIALILIFARMAAPAQQIQSATQNFFFSLPSFEAVRQLDLDLMREGSPTPAPILPPPGAVTLSDVRYLHPGGGGVKQASLTIHPGEFIGITGPSGAGKTTLVDLLIGLLAPQTGVMRIGGRPVDPAMLAGWREGIAYVPQDGFLFHDTVRRNLTWHDDAIDQARIDAAIRLAGAGPLIAGLPDGLETVIGERGAMLSGGERQRLALTRALIRQPRLLVLDEAANAIDAEGEAALLAHLAALDPRPTILMISHRAESMALCDRVITVERGLVTA
ncbi:hypothetical protein ASG11_15125 [Sphingomonas sp. Leaf357]|uniref:ABC transporter ATP-binding protein n=1 Tax=Sphingomonas sp. Leaf357 TaxID=1736350 RepID=UPI0006FBA258|nr:ABC transporter ATP-binding protein [Sphingomonas sp. Leaf357]KQS02117.1 hypothetical protein ASG11_15125 [Sphingomonas sp. Leaf357]